MSRALFGLVAGIAAVAIPRAATAATQFTVASVHQVATGSGVRDLPVVITSPAGYLISWREAPAALLHDSAAPARLVRQRLDLAGQPSAPPDTTELAGALPGRPALAAGSGQSWMAWDFTERGMRPGDRDLMLAPFSGWFETALPRTRLTREPPPGPPTHQAAPALLWDHLAGHLVLANTWTTQRPQRLRARGSPAAPDSTSIEIRVLAPDGALRHRFTVKGPDEPGEARDPALGFLPADWRERYIVAYTSNGGRRDLGAAGQSVYLELFGADWTVLGGRHMAWPVGGAAHPSVASVGGKLYFAWAEPATRDIWISELGHELWPRRPMRLRDALAESPAGELFALDAPGLGAPMLFDDFGMLGIVFIVTREWSPSSGRARQEVWLGRLGVGG